MREKHFFNDGWLFSKQADNFAHALDAEYEEVKIPHTWNNLDGQDGGGDYYRGTCGYKKSLILTEEDLSSSHHLEFEGVMSIADVYVNDTHLAHHEGGFSTFRVRLDGYLHAGTNTILVLADNSANQKVYPQFADFTFFGGIYRDVHLIKTSHEHFALDYFGTSGLKVLPKCVDGKWTVEATAYLEGNEDARVLFAVIDGGKTLETKEGEGKDPSATFAIENPHLWNGRKDPHLYLLRATLLLGEEKIDEVELHFGLRTFHVDPEKGFFLNGKPYHLHGVSRHQDRLDMGWAISKKEHDEDMALIEEVGATTIRLAHYQHAPYFYDLCDRVGMVVWAEIPYISAHMDTGKENAFSQMKELILQNFHRPSIVCWGLSNEITMRGESPTMIEDHKELNAMVHEMDQSRLTTIAEVSMTKMSSEMCQITDLISYNHYFGWYAGEVGQNGPWLDKFHSLYPKISLGLSEYGCEAILDWHSEDPKQGDYSEEYQAYYHEEMLKTFAVRPYLWSTHVWNMFDFAADNRDEGGKKGRNHKGLVTYDRKTKKDSFYLYKAYWNEEDKFVHICSKRYEERSRETIEVKVYTNLPEVRLTVNGVDLGAKEVRDHKAVFAVALREGENDIVATSGEYRDACKFIKVAEENEKYHLPNAGEVNNWFDENGNEKSFRFREGYLSVDAPISEIVAVPLGKAILSLFMKFGMKKMGMGDGGDFGELLDMVGSMTIRRVAKLAGGNVINNDVLYAINEVLNRIPKEADATPRQGKTMEVALHGETFSLPYYDGYANLKTKIKKLLRIPVVQGALEAVLEMKPEPQKAHEGVRLLRAEADERGESDRHGESLPDRLFERCEPHPHRIEIERMTCKQ